MRNMGSLKIRDRVGRSHHRHPLRAAGRFRPIITATVERVIIQRRTGMAFPEPISYRELRNRVLDTGGAFRLA
jgi:hypothetical protein